MLTSFARHLRRNLVAYIALFVSLGGASYAAATLPRNSVGTKRQSRAGGSSLNRPLAFTLKLC